MRATDLDWEESPAGRFTVVLPGERKLSTTCSLVVGEHSVSVQAFVVRRPDENTAAVHRWMLGRNTRLYAVAYALDRLGDVYLSGRLPHSAITAESLDTIMGSVLAEADGAFNTLLEMGFAGAIRAEWQWRVSRGEPTGNLEAFRHLTEPSGGTGGG
ncbi:MAG: YbjN domain-containing protein [Actinomycetota bacterium]|nr:YbjN domain-containing protein [Actinomycetota bacterium]